MTITIYSPDHHHSELYTELTKQYKAMGYDVHNPMGVGFTEDMVYQNVLDVLDKVNMVVCVNYDKRDKRVRHIQNECRRRQILFRGML